MNDPSTLDRILATIHDRLDLPPGTVRADTRLLDEMAVDSAGLMQLVIGLEEDFGITIEDRELTRSTFQDAGSLADLVESKQTR